ncbi:Transport protein yif1, partial [Coemansia erecta]
MAHNFHAQQMGPNAQQPMRGAFSPINPQQQQQQQQQFQQQFQQQPVPQQFQQPVPQQQFQQPMPNASNFNNNSNFAAPYSAFTQNFQNNQAAQLGIQFAGNAMNAMQENVQQNVEKYISMRQLKHYFDVSNIYVLSKLKILLFPWLQKSWHRHAERDQSGQVAG